MFVVASMPKGSLARLGSSAQRGDSGPPQAERGGIGDRIYPDDRPAVVLHHALRLPEARRRRVVDEIVERAEQAPDVPKLVI